MSAFHASDHNEMPRCPPSLLIQGHIFEEEDRKNGIPIEDTKKWREKETWPNSDAIEELQTAEDTRKRSASNVSQLSTASRQPSPSKIPRRGRI